MGSDFRPPTAYLIQSKEIHVCGIVGYIGDQEACPILIDGLKRLEYRGYDSAGQGKRIALA